MNVTQDSEDDKQKILFDLTFLFDQYAKRGIGIYGKNILSRLFKLLLEDENFEVHAIGFNSLTENLAALEYSQFTIEEISTKISFHSIGDPFVSDYKNRKRWSKLYKPILNLVNPDIFYALHFERGLPSVPDFAKELGKKPKTIVVTHDVIPLVNNKFSSKGALVNYAKKRFYKRMFEGVRNAEQIITASEFSKNDIIKFGKVDSKKIEVIYLGVDEKFEKDNYSFDEEKDSHILEAYNLKNKKYFFYDSGLEANKSIPTLLDVFKGILDLNSPNVPNFLVMIGKDFYKGEGLTIKPRSIEGENVLNYAKKIGVAQNIITTDKISDEHLIHLLFNSTTYINLSNYEGFGLGVAQAMSAGIPAIAADASCIPEVSQGGAYLIKIDPKKDRVEIAKDIVKYLGDEKEVSQRVKIGLKVAKRYDWDKATNQTFDLIKKLTL